MTSFFKEKCCNFNSVIASLKQGINFLRNLWRTPSLFDVWRWKRSDEECATSSIHHHRSGMMCGELSFLWICVILQRLRHRGKNPFVLGIEVLLVLYELVYCDDAIEEKHFVFPLVRLLIITLAWSHIPFFLVGRQTSLRNHTHKSHHLFLQSCVMLLLVYKLFTSFLQLLFIRTITFTNNIFTSILHYQATFATHFLANMVTNVFDSLSQIVPLTNSYLKPPTRFMMMKSLKQTRPIPLMARSFDLINVTKDNTDGTQVVIKPPDKDKG